MNKEYNNLTFQGTTGQIVDLENLHGIELLGNAVESSAYSINSGLYGSVHNNGHNLIANLTEGVTKQSTRSTVTYCNCT